VVRHHWRTVLRVFFVTFYAAMNTLISVFVISYATGASVGMERSELLMMNAAGIGASIVTIPLFAMLADRIGRRPVFLTGIIGATGSIYLIFWAITNGDWVLTFVGLFLNQAIFQGCFNGVWTVFFCEMFPTKIRYTGFALGNQIGLILVGFTPAIVGLLVPAGSTHWMPAAIYITVLLAISGIGIATARETHRVATHDLGKRGARNSL
jgi:MFS family permease